MVNKRLYWDAGHGGSDPGAIGNGLKEKDLTIKVVEYAYAYIKNNYVCDQYKDISDDSLYNEIIPRINKWDADLCVSVHFNAFKRDVGDGYEALVYSSKNKSLGQIFEKHVKGVGQNSRGVKYRPDLAILRDTECKAILNEIAFIDTKKDIQDWNEDHELKKMGEALAKAAAEYLKLPKKKVTPTKTLKVGAKVKIKLGATDLNTKSKYSSWVYQKTYTVISISGNRVVFGLNGVATGATNKSNITLV